MKIDVDISKFDSLMILAICACTAIIFGIQGIVYKDSFLRQAPYPRIEIIGSFAVGIIVLVGLLIMIFKN